MAESASNLNKHLSCSIFHRDSAVPNSSDSVTLSCKHTFCRDCLENSQNELHDCPICRSSLFRDTNFDTNPKAQEVNSIEGEEGRKPALERRKKPIASKRAACPEHREILKLYCETDRQLICVICRDGKDHKGHEFKPLKEAQDEIKMKIVTTLFDLQEDVSAVKKFQEGEQDIASRTKVRNDSLKIEICRQFEELQQQLKLKEQQALKELEELNIDCERQLEIIDNVIKEGRERKAILEAGLNMDQPLDFLRWWIETGIHEVKAVLAENHYAALNEVQSGSLINKCPLPSPKKPWTQDPASKSPDQECNELENLLEYLDLKGLGISLSRAVNPPLTMSRQSHEFRSTFEPTSPTLWSTIPSSTSMTSLSSSQKKNIFSFFKKNKKNKSNSQFYSEDC
ncbi:E3 ubiquitin-protein ligase TRIM17-like [Osmerus eperlanus]|uniref:E3 ubiquitin-protein ligase TRIM17-like n=1 Tax=Osmerus eperlanus TaxID=29151 RepID=UPI002E127FC7